MDQEKGLPAAVQKSPYHSTLIPGTSQNSRAANVSARCLYRDYLIELEHNNRGWRVVAIVHCLNKAKNFSPASVYHRDSAAAEKGGRALIDARMPKDRSTKISRQPPKAASRNRFNLKEPVGRHHGIVATPWIEVLIHWTKLG